MLLYEPAWIQYFGARVSVFAVELTFAVVFVLEAFVVLVVFVEAFALVVEVVFVEAGTTVFSVWVFVFVFCVYWIR